MIALKILIPLSILVVYLQVSEASFQNLRDMIMLTTHRNAQDFNGYGHYCGEGGEGTPEDEIDQCCKAHDDCHDNYPEECDDYWIEIDDYNWQYNAGEIICPSDGETCDMTSCKCDKAFAECLGKHNSTYNDAKKKNGGEFLNFFF